MDMPRAVFGMRRSRHCGMDEGLAPSASVSRRMSVVAIGATVARQYPGLVFAALALAFLVVPFVEVYIIITAGQSFGVLPTVLALVLVSIVGAALVKQQGLDLIRRARRQMDMGQVPGRELVDGILVLLAGALLLTPGFLTDALGLALLIPPVRSVLRSGAGRWLQRRTNVRIQRGWSRG